MRRHWHIRWGVVVAGIGFALSTTAQVGLAPAPDPTPSRVVTWDQICKLSIDDGRLLLRCDLSLESLKTLEIAGQQVAGMPGTTWVSLGSRRFQVRNVRRDGDVETTYTVFSTRTGLSLEMQRNVGGRIVNVSYYQTSAAYVQRGSNNIRLMIAGVNRDDEARNPEANDLATLRKEFPRETSRYLRPLLRDLGADLLSVQPAAARQVLFPTEEVVSESDNGATRPTTRPIPAPPGLVVEVERLVKQLDGPDFVRRDAALAQLARLGPPAVAAIGRMDRTSLSAQQNVSIDVLESVATPLPPEEARSRASDRNFLIDCLYVPDAAIRSAAATRLAELAGVSPTRFKAALDANPAKESVRVEELVEALRDELVK